MADDIVTRLRDTTYFPEICWEAADEIERLRAAGDALFNYLHDHPGSEIVRAAWQVARYG